MRTVTYRLDDLKRAVISIGKVAENEYTRVQIDAGDLYAEYPHAAASMTVQPPNGVAYPAVVTREGNLVIWDVPESALAKEGEGELQLAFEAGDVKIRSEICRVRVCRSIVGQGEAPDPLEDFLAEAGAALTAIPETIDAALEEAKESGEFDGPAGADGKDGKDGADGQPGADGFSPTATVTKSGKKTTITITDKNGTTTEEVLDGADGQPGAVQDVQINGTSILSNGVANVPKATNNSLGVVLAYTSQGLNIGSTGVMRTYPATDDDVKAGIHEYRPIIPKNQHQAAFYGLAKAAGDTTQASSSNAVGTYTANARKAIQNMFGVEGRMRYLKGITVTEETTSVGFDTDKDGLPFACDEFEVIALIPPVDGSSRTLVFGIETTEVSPSSSKWVGQCGGITNATNAYIVQTVIKRMQNAWMTRSFKCSSSSTDFTGAINTNGGEVRFSLNGASWVRSNNPMYATSFAICISNGIPVGTIFEIYAHDYQG